MHAAKFNQQTNQFQSIYGYNETQVFNIDHCPVFHSDQNQCLFAGYWLWIEESRSDTGHVPPPHTGHWMGQCWVWCDMGDQGRPGVRVTILHGSTIQLETGKTENKLAHSQHNTTLTSPVFLKEWSDKITCLLSHNITHCLMRHVSSFLKFCWWNESMKILPSDLPRPSLQGQFNQFDHNFTANILVWSLI